MKTAPVSCLGLIESDYTLCLTLAYRKRGLQTDLALPALEHPGKFHQRRRAVGKRQRASRGHSGIEMRDGWNVAAYMQNST